MDLNTNAFRIVSELTSEKEEDKRTAAARQAGKIGGPARAKKLSPEKRREIASKANEARWKKPENGLRKKTEGGAPVSDKLLQNLRELTRSVEENTPRVKDSMAKSGRRDPDTAVVSSAAKYHEALKKLAQE